jgi:rare lipoprotein A
MRIQLSKTPALLGVLACASCCMFAPSSAHALTGGAAPTAGGSADAASPTATSAPASAPGSAAQPSPTGASSATPETGATSATPTAEPAIAVSPGPVSFRTQSIALLGHTLSFPGSARSRDAGRTVAIELYDSSTGAWNTVTGTRVDRRGAFVARWRTNLLGRVTVRAVVLHVNGAVHGAHATQVSASTPTQVTVYRSARATYYGPGFFDQTTACGQTLTPTLIGVANRTLPCGTLVEVSYGGRRLTVPVVDRGPYANGADWDLTAGAAQALGITGTEQIGTLIVGSVPNSATLGMPPGPPPAVAATGGAAAG